MELLINDRLYLPAIFDKEGTFNDFNIKKSIMRKIEITQEERKRIEMKELPEHNRIEWNEKKATPIQVDFSQEEMQYLKSACEKVSEIKLPDDVWVVVEKIYDALQSEA